MSNYFYPIYLPVPYSTGYILPSSDYFSIPAHPDTNFTNAENFRNKLAIEKENNNVYITGLHSSTTDLSLSKLVPFETISAKAVMQDGVCKGIGFILFKHIDDAKKAIEVLNEMGYHARYAKKPYCDFKGLNDEYNCNLYVAGVPAWVDEQKLTSIGVVDEKVESCVIMKNKVGNVGFIRLSSRAEAESVLKRLNEAEFETGEKFQARFADTPAQKELKKIRREI